MKYCNTCKYFRLALEGTAHAREKSFLREYLIGEGVGNCCLVIPNLGRLTNSSSSHYYNYYDKACDAYADSIGAVYGISDEEIDSYPPSFNSIHSYIRYIAKGGGPWEDALEKHIQQ